jgi:hypothetical protein
MVVVLIELFYLLRDISLRYATDFWFRMPPPRKICSPDPEIQNFFMPKEQDFDLDEEEMEEFNWEEESVRGDDSEFDLTTPKEVIRRSNRKKKKTDRLIESMK